MRTTTMRLGFATAVGLACAVVGAGAAAADFAIHVKGSGEVARIGALRDPAAASLPTARAVFGAPAGARRDRESCPAAWPRIGLSILFVDLGGGNPCTADGNAQTANATQPRWHTARGLHVGDPVAKLRRLYPRARRLYGQLALISRPSPFGDGGRLVPLGARVGGGKVRALRIWLGGAGE